MIFKLLSCINYLQIGKQSKRGVTVVKQVRAVILLESVPRGYIYSEHTTCTMFIIAVIPGSKFHVKNGRQRYHTLPERRRYVTELALSDC